jgi:hypothetical protein
MNIQSAKAVLYGGGAEAADLPTRGGDVRQDRGGREGTPS